MAPAPAHPTGRAPSTPTVPAEIVEDTSSRQVEVASAQRLTWDPTWDIVDEWGAQSFPASDPPANW
jgi:hypothetical protein